MTLPTLAETGLPLVNEYFSCIVSNDAVSNETVYDNFALHCGRCRAPVVGTIESIRPASDHELCSMS